MPKRMLIVDDDLATREVYAEVFTGKGLEVSEASNGRDALGRLQKESIDIVFLDLEMPVMTGEELMEAMAKDEKLKKIPILIESAQAEVAHRQDKLHDQFKGRLKFVCLTRPSSLEKICTIVDEFLA